MKDDIFWTLYNYYLVAWGSDSMAYRIATNELGYEPTNEAE